MPERPRTLRARVDAGSVLLWGLLILVESGAQIALRLGGLDLGDRPFGLSWIVAALATPAVLVAIGCYVGSFLTWMLILRRTDLSFAFPFSALVFIAVLVASRLGLRESIPFWHWVGTAVIILGILLLGGDDQEGGKRTRKPSA